MEQESPSINDLSEVSQTENFLHLLMANHRRIYAFILGMIANRSDADDLMQETTTVMWRKFGEFEGGTDFVAWGVTIAKYRILNYRQKNRHTRIQFSDEAVKVLQADADSMLDTMDTRIVDSVRDGTGGIIDSQDDVGGFPTASPVVRPLVLPDNPQEDGDGNGYTNLEEWLHDLAAEVEGRT